MAKVRVFIASSLDGFIAGPNDELDWLGAPEGTEDTFTPFFTGVGAMLMGRRTYDAVSSFDAWAYGDTPIVVASSRELPAIRDSIQVASGSIDELVARARDLAGEKDVYIDGGCMIRSALDAGLIDDMTVTIIPMILGSGIPLFAGAAARHPLRLVNQRTIGGGLVELQYQPER